MEAPAREFRPSGLHSAALLALASASCTAVVFLRDSMWLATFFAGFALIGVLAAVGRWRTRITLHADRIEIVDGFIRRTLPKQTIASASWERGCPAAIALKGGGFVKLPSAGGSPQELCGAIQRWSNAR